MEDKLIELIEEIKQLARYTWPGLIGDERAIEVEKFIKGFLPSYSVALNLSELELLTAIHKRRNVNVVNYYQLARFPPVARFTIYETQNDAMENLGREFRCPSCSGVSTDPYECNSGLIVDGEECSWTTFGLFRCMGKGFLFTIKEDFINHPRIDEIFMPLTKEKTDVSNED